MRNDVAALDKLTKIMRSWSSEFKGLRDAAGTRFKATLFTAGLNASDLAVVIVNSELAGADEHRSVLEDTKKWRQQMDRDNQALRAANREMLEFIESNHGKEQKRQFERQPILPQWSELEELIRTRVFFGADMPQDWCEVVAPKLNATVALMAKWRQGTVGIPPEVMQTLYDLPADVPADPLLTTKVADLEGELAKLKETGKAKEATKRRTTNFQEIIGELVNAARIGGMAPKTIYQALNTFYQDFDGGYLTPNMIYGRRLLGNPDYILPDGDMSPLSRPEVVAMQTKLWGQENNIKPMIRFIITHTQANNISDYMMDDSLEELNPKQCVALRRRFYRELKLRAANPRYEKFSRGFALLKKRTTKLGRHIDDHHSDEVMNLAEEWFGSDDAEHCIAQLCGYDHFSIEEAVNYARQFPQELRDTVAVMKRLVEGCDPDDPKFEETIAARVRTENRETAMR